MTNTMTLITIGQNEAGIQPIESATIKNTTIVKVKWTIVFLSGLQLSNSKINETTPKNTPNNKLISMYNQILWIGGFILFAIKMVKAINVMMPPQATPETDF